MKRGIQCGLPFTPKPNPFHLYEFSCPFHRGSTLISLIFICDLAVGRSRVAAAGKPTADAHESRRHYDTYAPRMPIPRRRANGAELRGRSVGAGPRSAVHHQRVSLGASRHLHSPVHTAALRPMRRGQAETHSLCMAAERMRSARVHRRASVQAVARTLPPHGGKAHETLASPARSSSGRASPLASFLLA